MRRSKPFDFLHRWFINFLLQILTWKFVKWSLHINWIDTFGAICLLRLHAQALKRSFNREGISCYWSKLSHTSHEWNRSCLLTSITTAGNRKYWPQRVKQWGSNNGCGLLSEMSERQERLLVKKRHDRWCSWLVLENVPFFRSSFPEIYVRDIINGTTQPQGEPSIEKETGPTALVNGNNLLGPVSGSVELWLCFGVGSTSLLR